MKVEAKDECARVHGRFQEVKAKDSYTFDISRARHHGALLEEVISSSAGRFISEAGDGAGKKADFVWLGPTAKPDEIYQILEHDAGRIVNRYPNVKELCRKDTFKTMMDVMHGLNPNDFEFMPLSFTFPQEINKWKEYAKANPKATFITKPIKGCEGKGICLFTDLS